MLRCHFVPRPVNVFIFLSFNIFTSALTLVKPVFCNRLIVGFGFLANNLYLRRLALNNPLTDVPSLMPRRFAACKASLVLWLMSFDSRCAFAASICNSYSSACGLSTEINRTDDSINVAMKINRLASLSSLAISKVASCFPHASSTCDRTGLSFFLPDSTSVNSATMVILVVAAKSRTALRCASRPRPLLPCLFDETR